MSDAINAFEKLIGDHLLRTATWSKPSTIYVGLFTTMPNEAGASGVEVSGGSYARVQCGPGDAYWNGPAEGGNGVYTNISIIQFATPTASWGTILGYGLFSAATAGTLYIAKLFDFPITIANGDPAPGFAAQSITVTID